MFYRKLSELMAVNNYAILLLTDKNNSLQNQSMEWNYSYLRDQIKTKEIRKMLDDIHKNKFGWCTVDNDEESQNNLKGRIE